MNELEKPIIYASKCLGFDHCRYNGLIISSDFVRLLRGHVKFALLCPEVEIGLGVPRYAVRIVSKDKELRLLQSVTEADVTDKMKKHASEALDLIGEVDGFILKSRSPTCGFYGVKVYPGLGKVGAHGKTTGFLGGQVILRFAHLPVEDEGRLNNFRIREHFLTRIFTTARFRAVRRAGKMKDLVEFQARHKYLLMAYSQKGLQALGRIVANHERRPVDKVFDAYESELYRALSRIPRYTSQINVLQHVSGHFSKKVNTREKWFINDAIDKFREERVPLSVPIHVLRSLAIRFEDDYVVNQAFFEPYPIELVSITDSGKGRKL